MMTWQMIKWYLKWMKIKIKSNRIYKKELRKKNKKVRKAEAYYAKFFFI